MRAVHETGGTPALQHELEVFRVRNLTVGVRVIPLGTGFGVVVWVGRQPPALAGSAGHWAPALVRSGRRPGLLQVPDPLPHRPSAASDASDQHGSACSPSPGHRLLLRPWLLPRLDAAVCGRGLRRQELQFLRQFIATLIFAVLAVLLGNHCRSYRSYVTTASPRSSR
jgi:hypothetical protein